MKQKLLTILAALGLALGLGTPADAATITWHFGAGDWGTCTRWADNDEAHMRCYTPSSSYPRVSYRTVTTWYNTVRGTYHTINGSQQSVDGGWGPWSDGYAPATTGYVLYSNSYWITW